jgi:hypothetical protein
MRTEDAEEDVHPVELTVQSLLETPLELLNLNLKSLYESQIILHAILSKMESSLLESADNLKGKDYDENELQKHLDRIIALRQKVGLIEKILNGVETRISRMENTVV